MRILLGIVTAAVGVLITLKSEWIYQNFGTIPFFEQYFHSSGGGRFGYRLVGIIVAIIGIFIMTNIIQNILAWIAGLFSFGI